MWVQSSAIREIDYENHHGKLSVRFTDGDLYIYVGVPDETWRGFVAALSKGRYFAEEIRDRYPFNRIPN